jgi:hypothetical protein
MKKAETWGEMSVNFGSKVSLSHSTGHKILQHGADSFTSPTKEVVLWIYITLKKSIVIGRV